MQPARIAELLHPFLNPCHSERPYREESAVLSATQLSDISTYIDLLLRWNARINLTALRTAEEILTRHFGESLFAATHLFPQPYPVTSPVPPVSPVVKDFDPAVANARIADLGSGAGFPGVPLKLWTPAIHMTLIESNHKKSTFLRELIRTLTLTGINVQTTRAESITATFDLVTLRAVEHFSTILPVAARLTAPTGRLALLIGSSQLPQARNLLPDFPAQIAFPIPNSDSRLLLIATRNSPQ